jgi:3-phosphoshikimate 1-carboxyvinyltransferase
MRFLTAYLATTTQKNVCITGTERMQKRPIGTLVDALMAIGANISYANQSAYPPLNIEPLVNQKSHEISIKGNISSQYISALLMIAPKLPEGLSIEIIAPIYSQPYIDMTLSLMQQAGIAVLKDRNTYTISPQDYQPSTIAVESDWSGASYWFSFIALGEIAQQLHLKGLMQESFQGDQAIVKIMKQLGVQTTFDEQGVLLEKIAIDLPEAITLDFKEFPDLAQTVVACCAALGVNLHMTGLESLRIKETDRIVALDQELQQFDCSLKEVQLGQWELEAKQFNFPKLATINTYEDHRMAMSFMPLTLKGNLFIKEVEVVNKSYPSFWEDCQLVGLELIDQ